MGRGSRARRLAAILGLGIAALAVPGCPRTGLSPPDCDPTGYWMDEKGRAVEMSLHGAAVTSVRLDPMYCDPIDGDEQDGSGNLLVGYAHFEASATSGCTASGTVKACRWGDTECPTGIVDIELVELRYSSTSQIVGEAHDPCTDVTLELRYEELPCEPRTASDYLPGDLLWDVERHHEGTEIHYETLEPTAVGPQEVLAALAGTVTDVDDPDDGGATITIEAPDGSVVYELFRPGSRATVETGNTTGASTPIGILEPFGGHLTLGLEGYDADGEPIDPHCVGRSSGSTRRPSAAPSRAGS